MPLFGHALKADGTVTGTLLGASKGTESGPVSVLSDGEAQAHQGGLEVQERLLWRFEVSILVPLSVKAKCQFIDTTSIVPRRRCRVLGLDVKTCFGRGLESLWGLECPTSTIGTVRVMGQDW